MSETAHAVCATRWRMVRSHSFLGQPVTRGGGSEVSLHAPPAGRFGKELIVNNFSDPFFTQNPHENPDPHQCSTTHRQEKKPDRFALLSSRKRRLAERDEPQLLLVRHLVAVDAPRRQVALQQPESDLLDRAR